MADTALFNVNDAPAAQSVWSKLGEFFAVIGRAVVASREFNQRQSEIAALSALSDQDLAARGIARERIVQHVYDDIFAA